MQNGLFSTQGISLERMQNFCRVAETESFTVAADGDPNRQTLYSRQVKDLERFFGTELFVRKGRTVVLSESGRQLHALLSEYFNALEDFKELCSDSVRSFNIGTGDNFIQWGIIPRLEGVRELLGNSEINFLNLRSRDVVDGLKKGTLDFGIIRSSSLPTTLQAIELGRWQYSLFVPRDSGLNSKNALAGLSDLSFVGMEGEGSYQNFLNRFVSENGLLLRYALYCSSFPMMAKAMKSLSLAGILPSAASDELGKEAFTKINLDCLLDLSRDLCLAWNPRLARVTPGFVENAEALAKLLSV